MTQQTPPSTCDVVVVGAGFAGMYQLKKLRELGFSARVFEVGGGVGGTWYWNRYPGARCDVESMQYSYQFDDDLQQQWEWTERYAPQPEILSYAQHVADRFDLLDGITFNTRVTKAAFDETTNRWSVTTEGVDDSPAAGNSETVDAQFIVMATGCLSSANLPDIAGRDDFEGEAYHTGRWPHDGVDFSGKRVGVIGTGSSALQSIPVIAEQAAALTVFQRTATYSVPAHNAPLDPDVIAKTKANYAELRAQAAMTPTAIVGGAPGEFSALAVEDEQRLEILENAWAAGGLAFMGAFNDLLIVPDANQIAADFVRSKIRAIVDDPETAEKLCPTQTIGCKRLCVDTGYYATYNRPNVSLVDLTETPIERITADGIRLSAGAGSDDAADADSPIEHDLDVIVFATGFDAMTGALDKIEFTGRGGRTLSEAWAEGPKTYLGLNVSGFPNLFIITGPGSPSVLTNMFMSIQQHVEWISDALVAMRDRGAATIEAQEQSQEDWVMYVNSVAAFTLFPTCNSWYLGANIPGKPRVFMPLLGFPTYVDQCNDVVANDYRGFELQPA